MTIANSRLFIVVLYKLDIQGSNTLSSLKAAADVLNKDDKLIVWDNSPVWQADSDIHLLKLAMPASVDYRHTPENISLARIYNIAVAGNNEHELIILLDQDSSFDASYLEKLQSVVQSNPKINLFVPLIMVGETVVSPGHFRYFKGKYWEGPQYGIVSSKNTVAIASGMCIRMTYLKTFGGFNEALKLYGIDTNFMIRYSRDNDNLYVIKAPFKHHLSDFAKESRETKNRRFEDFKRSSLINAALFPWHIRALTRLFLLYRTLKNLTA